jgi:Zn-dependent protease
MQSTLDIVLTLVVLVLSIIAHEVAHGYAANSLGDPTARLAGRLTLNPFPHIDPLGSVIIPGLLVLTGSPILFGWAKPVPYNPYNLRNKRWGEAIVAVAGSATNLLLAIIFALIIRIGGATLGDTALGFLATICFVNLFLGLFNLIPFPPLDGFTFIRGLLPYHLARNLISFENQIRAYGPTALIAFLLVFSYILAGPFSNLVAWLFKILVGG